jgi:hypothetical protein
MRSRRAGIPGFRLRLHPGYEPGSARRGRPGAVAGAPLPRARRPATPKATRGARARPRSPHEGEAGMRGSPPDSAFGCIRATRPGPPDAGAQAPSQLRRPARARRPTTPKATRGARAHPRSPHEGEAGMRGSLPDSAFGCIRATSPGSLDAVAGAWALRASRPATPKGTRGARAHPRSPHEGEAGMRGTCGACSPWRPAWRGVITKVIIRARHTGARP